MAKKHCSKLRWKLAKRMQDLEKELKNIRSNPELDMRDTLRAHEEFLANELGQLEHIHARDKRDDSRAIIANHGKVLGGVWSAMNEDWKPRDILYKLTSPDGGDTE